MLGDEIEVPIAAQDGGPGSHGTAAISRSSVPVVRGSKSLAKIHVALDEQGRVLGHQVKVPVEVHHGSARRNGDHRDEQIGVRNSQASGAELTPQQPGLRPSLFGGRQDWKGIEKLYSPPVFELIGDHPEDLEPHDSGDGYLASGAQPFQALMEL